MSSCKRILAKARKCSISIRKQRSLCSAVRVFQKALGKGRNREGLLNGPRVSFGSDEAVLELVGVIENGTKCRWVLHFKMVQIMFCEF